GRRGVVAVSGRMARAKARRAQRWGRRGLEWDRWGERPGATRAGGSGCGLDAEGNAHEAGGEWERDAKVRPKATRPKPCFCCVSVLQNLARESPRLPGYCW